MADIDLLAQQVTTVLEGRTVELTVELFNQVFVGSVKVIEQATGDKYSERELMSDLIKIIERFLAKLKQGLEEEENNG